MIIIIATTTVTIASHISPSKNRTTAAVALHLKA